MPASSSASCSNCGAGSPKLLIRHDKADPLHPVAPKRKLACPADAVVAAVAVLPSVAEDDADASVETLPTRLFEIETGLVAATSVVEMEEVNGGANNAKDTPAGALVAEIGDVPVVGPLSAFAPVGAGVMLMLPVLAYSPPPCCPAAVKP